MLRDLDDEEAGKRPLDGRGEGGEEGLADGLAGGVGRVLGGGVLDAEGGAGEEVAGGAGRDRAPAAEVGGVGEGVDWEDGGVGEAGLLGDSHDLVDGAGPEPGFGGLPDGGAVLAAGRDRGEEVDDVLAADHGAELRPLGGDGLVGAGLAIGARDDAEGVGDAAGGAHGRALHAHGQGGDDGHDDVQGEQLDVDAGGVGALAGGEGEGLQEDGRGGRLGNDGRDVAGGGHEAVVGVVEGGVAGADGAARAGNALIGRGDLDAGVRFDGRLAVITDTDGRARARLCCDAESLEQRRQGRGDAGLRAHEHGQGEGFEAHGALR